MVIVNYIGGSGRFTNHPHYLEINTRLPEIIEQGRAGFKIIGIRPEFLLSDIEPVPIFHREMDDIRDPEQPSGVVEHPGGLSKKIFGGEIVQKQRNGKESKPSVGGRLRRTLPDEP